MKFKSINKCSDCKFFGLQLEDDDKKNIGGSLGMNLTKKNKLIIRDKIFIDQSEINLINYDYVGQKFSFSPNIYMNELHNVITKMFSYLAIGLKQFIIAFSTFLSASSLASSSSPSPATFTILK